MRISLLIMFCFAKFLVNAQDSIYKRTGDVISAKVLEINAKEISYKRADLIEGPLFIINKNEVKKIKYVTGTIDSFAVIKEIIKRPLAIKNPVLLDQDQIYTTGRKGVYLFQSHRISDKKLLFLANEKNQYWKNEELALNINSCKRNKTLQYLIGNVGLGVGVIGLYGSLLATGSIANTNDAYIIAICGIASAGILVSSQVVSFSYKLKRVKNADKVAELYNKYSIIK